MTEPDTRRRFRIAVAARRKTLDLTQRDVIERLAAVGVPMHQSALAKIEKGDREPKIDEVAAIAGVLGLDLDDVLVPPHIQRERQIASAHAFMRRARTHLSGAAMESAALLSTAQQTGSLERTAEDLFDEQFLIGLWEQNVVTVPSDVVKKLIDTLLERGVMNLVQVADDA